MVGETRNPEELGDVNQRLGSIWMKYIAHKIIKAGYANKRKLSTTHLSMVYWPDICVSYRFDGWSQGSERSLDPEAIEMDPDIPVHHIYRSPNCDIDKKFNHLVRIWYKDVHKYGDIGNDVAFAKLSKLIYDGSQYLDCVPDHLYDLAVRRIKSMTIYDGYRLSEKNPYAVRYSTNWFYAWLRHFAPTDQIDGKVMFRKCLMLPKRWDVAYSTPVALMDYFADDYPMINIRLMASYLRSIGVHHILDAHPESGIWALVAIVMQAPYTPLFPEKFDKALNSGIIKDLGLDYTPHRPEVQYDMLVAVKRLRSPSVEMIKYRDRARRMLLASSSPIEPDNVDSSKSFTFTGAPRPLKLYLL